MLLFLKCKTRHKFCNEVTVLFCEFCERRFFRFVFVQIVYADRRAQRLFHEKVAETVRRETL